MSTRYAGAASRMFSSGSRLWPPASTLPSSPTRASSASASSRLAGAVQANGEGFTRVILPHWARQWASMGQKQHAPAADEPRRGPALLDRTDEG